MLSTFLIVLAFMVAFVAVMAVGVLFGQKPIAGSCGGMAGIGMESECDVCGGDKSKCDKEDGIDDKQSGSDLAYNASK